MAKRIILSHFQAKEIANAILDRKETIRVSLDLGISKSTVTINDMLGNVVLTPEATLTFDDISKVASTEQVCFVVENNSLVKVQLFSEETNRFYKLYPTPDAPTAEISGIRMHRVTERTPWQDTQDKVKVISPLSGKILDTCCGLGYTAILSARAEDVERVFTFERDQNMVLLADYNPWSQELFKNLKIKLAVEDVKGAMTYFDPGFFNAIIHDPPRQALSPELYSFDFYKDLHRVLKKGGKLYHYTGSPGEKKGINIVRGVIRRLKEAGFSTVTEKKDVLGVLAIK